MERCDADQEVPRRRPDDATRLYIAEQLEDALSAHSNECAFTKLDVEHRLRSVELSFAKLIGFLIGAGILGGAAGGAVAKLLH